MPKIAYRDQKFSRKSLETIAILDAVRAAGLSVFVFDVEGIGDLPPVGVRL